MPEQSKKKEKWHWLIVKYLTDTWKRLNYKNEIRDFV